MRDIYDIRRENLAAIVENVFAGNRSKAAEKFEFEQPSLLSRYLSTAERTRKNIGTALARKIEFVARKPENWMDTDHSRMVSEPVGPGYGRPRLNKDLLINCIETVRVLLMETDLPRSDEAFTEDAIMSRALDLYAETEQEEDGYDRQELKRKARRIIDIPLPPPTRKKT